MISRSQLQKGARRRVLGAGVAFAGLGANTIEDAVYPTAITDVAGKPFSSDNRYVLHFDKDGIPPVHAFWSLTMYNEKQAFAANPIDRYAIGNRDKLSFNPERDTHTEAICGPAHRRDARR